MLETPRSSLHGVTALAEQAFEYCCHGFAASVLFITERVVMDDGLGSGKQSSALAEHTQVPRSGKDSDFLMVCQIADL